MDLIKTRNNCSVGVHVLEGRGQVEIEQMGHWWHAALMQRRRQGSVDFRRRWDSPLHFRRLVLVCCLVIVTEGHTTQVLMTIIAARGAGMVALLMHRPWTMLMYSWCLQDVTGFFCSIVIGHFGLRVARLARFSGIQCVSRILNTEKKILRRVWTSLMSVLPLENELQH